MSPERPASHAGQAPGEEEPSALVSAAQEFLEYMQVERGVSPNTLAAYRRALVRYLDFQKSLQ